MKKKVFTIDDYDFGEVGVFYHPDSKAITADSLSIMQVPDNWTKEMVMQAWLTYRKWYWQYATMSILYEQIPGLDKMIMDAQ